MFGTLISSYHTSLCIPLCCYSAIGSRYPRYKYNHVTFRHKDFGNPRYRTLGQIRYK